jgi:threonine/homoserine efflux transporter RhtA
VLTAVLFASVLFFPGTAAKFRPQWIRWSMIAVAVVVFTMGVVVEFTLPQNVGF